MIVSAVIALRTLLEGTGRWRWRTTMLHTGGSWRFRSDRKTAENSIKIEDRIILVGPGGDDTKTACLVHQSVVREKRHLKRTPHVTLEIITIVSETHTGIMRCEWP